MKTKYISSLLIMLFPMSQLMAQVSESRTLDSFSKINISGNSKVYVTIASPQSVRVETKNRLEDVQTVVSKGTLKIDGKPSSVYINTPSIEAVSISGFGELRSESTFKGESLKLEVNGNGKVILPMEVKSLIVDVSGFSKMRLTGSADDMQLSISGNGTIDAEGLATKTADVNVSGVGKANVDVADKLNLDVSGVGSVYNKNEPKEITKNVSGIGKYGFINKDDRDTTTLHMGKKRIVIIGGEEKAETNNDNVDIDINVDTDDAPKPPKKARSHWSGIDVGFNGLFNDGTSTDLPKGYDFLELNSGKSIGVNLNFWSFDIKLYKRYIMLNTGIGLTLNNYRFTSDRTLISDTNHIAAGFDFNNNGEQIGYIKNKLSVNYVTVPLLLQFNSNEKLKKSFHLAGGLLFSYKYNSHLKLVYDENGDKQKSKRKDEFNIEPFRYDATVRLGYRNYTLFGTYAISEFFKGSRGPSLHPYTVGVQLAGW